jgi:hypothetical protein
MKRNGNKDRQQPDRNIVNHAAAYHGYFLIWGERIGKGTLEE